MASSFPSPLVRKEFRALLPLWLATLATMTATGLSGAPLSLGMIAYVLGTTTLGALAIGHEYSSGTLAQLLAQPGSRIRILLTKLAVLGTMLLVLAAAALLMIQRAEVDGVVLVAFSPDLALTIVLLPLVGGLTVAPWLTMCCRNPMAGVVFTMSIPAALWAGQAAFVSARHNWNLPPVGSAFNPSVLWVGVLATSAMAVVLGRRMFVRLEAIDGHFALSLPGLRSAPRLAAVTVAGATHRRRHPVALLVAKELRLQSVAMLVALLYVLVRVAMAFSGMPPDVAETLGGGVSVMYVFLVSLLVGSLASAEERALGTIGWQVLQPLAFWKQWAIKVATALAVAMVLVLALPLLLQQINLVPDFESMTRLSYGRHMWENYGRLVWPLRRDIPRVLGLSTPAVVVVLCVSCGLYISSLCRSGLRALLFTLSFVAVTASGFSSLFLAARDVVEKGLDLWLAYVSFGKFSRLTGDDLWWIHQVWFWLPAVLIAGFVLLLLVLGGRNHRSAEHGSMLARLQVVWLVAYVVAAAVAIGAIPPLFFYTLATR